MMLDCTGTTQVMVDPWDSRYSRPSDFCDTGGVRLVARFNQYARQLWDDETGEPLTDYAEALRPALQLALGPVGASEAGSPITTAAFPPAEAAQTALRDQLVAALEAGDWQAAARTARQAEAQARSAGEAERVAALETLATETTFRAAGVDPAGAGYFAATPDGAVLTQEGRVQIARLGAGATETQLATETASSDTQMTTADARGGTGEPTLSMETMTAGDLKGLAVYDAGGMEIGEIDELVTTDGRFASVISVGGFLGIGDKPVAIDLGALRPGRDGVVVGRLTGDDIEGMAEYDFTGTPVPDETRLNEIWRME